MYISYNWLKEYIDIPFSPMELADRLTMLGLEVASVTEYAKGLSFIKIGQIKGISPHPNADKLCLCQVDIGDGEVSVVCGATNMKPGDRVPVALPGADLPKTGKIKETHIRGIASYGMLCSQFELELGSDRSGLMILPDIAPVGVNLTDYLNLPDTILEVELTPNRADCLSHIGIAREIAAITDQKVSLLEISFPEEGGTIHDLVKIQIRNPDLCFRYVARVITGITIAPSPPWLAARLESVGIRSINNIVDITNLVLMETGQPLHAFDYDLIQGKKVIVRPAERGEIFKTLDGVERNMDETMLMIADKDHSIAIAGIMGGLESEVTENTKNVLIESALFNPASVRRTSRSLGLSTEASQRFERGIDHEGVPVSADRATQLILKLAGGKIAKGAIDLYPSPVKRNPIRLSVRRVNSILGVKLATDRIHGILNALCFQSISQARDEMEFIPPSFRQDISQEIDLIEEIARIYGYTNIPTSLPCGQIPMGAKLSPELRLAPIIRDILTGFGLYEVINYSFTKKGLFDNIQNVQEGFPIDVVCIKNPLTEDQNILRPGVIQSLLQNMVFNQSRQNRDMKIFELSNCFFPSPNEDGLPVERKRIGIALMGQYTQRHWQVIGRDTDFYCIKGIVEALLRGIGICTYGFGVAVSPWFDKDISLQLFDDNKAFGMLGLLSEQAKNLFDIKKPVFMAELDLDYICEKARPGQHTFKALPKYPPVLRDLAVVIDKGISYQKVLSLICEEGNEWVHDVDLFDMYVGPQIPNDKKSLAFSLTYRSEKRTLTDEEVNTVHERIFRRLNTELNAELR